MDITDNTKTIKTMKGEGGQTRDTRGGIRGTKRGKNVVRSSRQAPCGKEKKAATGGHLGFWGRLRPLVEK